jgi:hypothetical protein
MTKWLWTLLLCLAGTAQAATYYVRPDGDSTCTGLSDAAFTGGTACAKQTPAQGVGAMAGGDTLIIRNGSYSVSGAALIPPSGTSSAYTRIYGANYANCTSKPELWGTGGRSRIFDLSGRSYVELSCLEITDHSSCVYGHPTLGCGSSTTHARDGVYAKTSSFLVLRDLNIHGLENGFHGGSVNTMTLERVRLNANAKAGFHGATGCSSTTTCDSFSGTLTFRQVEIAWNGCGENYPSLAIHGCYGQGRGGYGDGLGTYHTSGTWIFEDSQVHHNASDGLDLRYTTDAAADVQIRRSWCGYFGSRYGTDSGGNPDPEPCRADGNTVVILPDHGGSGDDAILRYNTIAGHPAALIQFASGGSTTNYTVRLENNVVIGATFYKGTALAKYISNGAGVSYSQHNNHVFNAGSVSCTASECVTTDPLLFNQAITAFDPRPQAASSVIGAGGCSGCTTPTTDIRGKTRPASPARGAFEP